MVRADSSSNTERSGDYVYLKVSFVLCLLAWPYLEECF